MRASSVKKSTISMLMLLCVSACFRAAPPLEEDEVQSETPAETNSVDIPTPISTSSPRTTPKAITAATPTPTPAPTPERPNNAPLIMQIGDQTANEDTQLNPISFRIFDFDDSVKCMNVVPSSSNDAAVYISTTSSGTVESKTWGDATVTGGETTECGISIKTKYASQTPATITLSLKDPSDDSKVSKSSFSVTVNSTNTEPYISSNGAASETLDEDSIGTSILMAAFDDNTKRINHALKYEWTASPTLGDFTFPVNVPSLGSPAYGTYKPKPNLNGIDSFSYKVCDNDPGINKCSSEQTVVLNIRPVNDFPEMEPIADQTTSEAAAKFIEFKMTDIDGPLECNSPNLSYSVSTLAGDNSSLVEPTGAVAWGGTWPYCSATLTPKNLQSGTIHIKFSFNDGNPAATAEQTFKLTVLGSNHAPEITSTINSQTVNEDSSVAVAFVVDDIDKNAGNASQYVCTSDRLSYTTGNSTLVSGSSRVTWSGTWPNCTGTISPNANANGILNITFTVTDPGGLSASKTFQLNITAQNDPPTGTVICDSNSTTDIVKAGRTGNWTLSCTGASDVDGETLTYSLVRDASSPFNKSSGFSCANPITGSNISQAFSTTEYGTCKYKARACDASGSCTSDTVKFIEITSYQLNLNALSKPSLSSSCNVSNTASFAISSNISSFNYTATVVQQDVVGSPAGLSVTSAAKTISSSNDSVSFSSAVTSSFLIPSTPAKDTSSTFKSVFAVTTGSFSSPTQGGSGTGNTITNTVSSANFTFERKLEKLNLRWFALPGSFNTSEMSVDGLQPEYASTPSICRQCTSSTYASISAGALHTCLVDNGVSKCWGRSDGRLGLANTLSQATYTYPQTSSTSSTTQTTAGFTFVQLASGSNFTCALGTASGTAQVRCVGNNSSGQLGLAGNQTAFNNPVGFPAGDIPIGIAASKTGTHACAISNSGSVLGKLYCWGNNDSGQLGTGNNTSSGSSGSVYAVGKGDLSDQNSKIFSVAAGKSHTCALQFQSSSTTTQAFCWGKNNSGQLGNSSTTDSSLPVSLGFNEDVSQITSGDNHSCVLTKGGEIYCWGDNSVGQLGLGNTTSSTTPVKLTSPALKYVQISAGSNHTCALTEDSQVYCWGLGTSGQLGVGKVTTTDQASGEDCNPGTGIANITFCKQSPTIIDPAPTTTAMSISAGDLHTCMMTLEGNVYCWGANTDGQLGTSNKSQVSSPASVCSGSSPCTNSGQLTTPRPRMCSRYSIP